MKLRLVKQYVSLDSISLECVNSITVTFVVEAEELKQLIGKERELEKWFVDEVRRVLNLREGEKLDTDERGRYVISSDDDDDRPLTKEQMRIVLEIRKKYDEELRKLRQVKEAKVRELIGRYNKLIPKTIEIEV